MARRGNSEGKFQRHLNGTRSVLLRGRHDAKAGARWIGVGRREASVIERVEALETVLQFKRFADLEILEDPRIQVVGAAGANAAPPGREGAVVRGEVLVDAVLYRVAGGGFVVTARQVHHTCPGRERGDV